MGGCSEPAVARFVEAASRHEQADSQNSRHYQVGVATRCHWTNHLQSPLNPFRDGVEGARRVRVAMSVLNGGEVSHRGQVSSSRSNHVVEHLISAITEPSKLKIGRYNKNATKRILAT